MSATQCAYYKNQRKVSRKIRFSVGLAYPKPHRELHKENQVVLKVRSQDQNQTLVPISYDIPDDASHGMKGGILSPVGSLDIIRWPQNALTADSMIPNGGAYPKDFDLASLKSPSLSPSVLYSLNENEVLDLWKASPVRSPFHLPLYDSPRVVLPIALNETEMSYFDYYCSHVANEISIVPGELNYFLKVFLPMALKNEGVLACLIAWGCIFKNNKSRTTIDELWIQRAMLYVKKSQETHGLTGEVFLTSFACYMILVCLEVSVGDTDAWSRFLTCGYDLINSFGRGFAVLENFSTEGHLLADNFAYFDILASQSHDNGTYYGVEEYADTHNTNQDGTMFDSLQGCIRPLILKLGDVVNLVRNMKLIREANDITDDQRVSMLTSVLERATELDLEVENSKLNASDFDNLVRGDVPLEHHLTLFELFQLAIQIHLRQAVRRLPPIVPEIQCLLYRMKSCLKVIINSSVKSSLCFPLLIAGLSCVKQTDRDEIRGLINALISRYEFSSINKAMLVLEEVWRLNMDGAICVDWFKITKQFGWRLNLGR
ncbi:unnamed protein product [Kuraishia capsulata CBS 1993]|uniref:Transcription factor domain-containing protein n=1 Tax=Kuraishia capsulata CBS 1993 TaxID=1382522 RepID=W6MTE4_9ASCO|nr:uncharacterized protein KUCA_T00000967001 [Kuraishia capsulata CBS 1993]CDK25000.1 unnamed protein product [Kuraishia capsulata CBS 1993]